MRIAIACVLLVVIAATGCAPVTSGIDVRAADAAIATAKAAGAEKSAAYEYTAASEYLKKAREEAGYSDFHASRLFAEKATKMAEAARAKAIAAAQTEQALAAPPSAKP